MHKFIKKSLFLSLTVVTMIAASACGKRKVHKEPVSSEELTQEIISGIAEGFKNGDIEVTSREQKMINNLVDYVLANPETSLASLKEAADRAGFSANFPESIDGAEPYFNAVANQLIEADYITQDGDNVVIRKGLDADTLSEILRTATVSSTPEVTTIDGKEVSISSDGDKIYDALWEESGKAYSIYSENGLDEETINKLIKMIE